MNSPSSNSTDISESENIAPGVRGAWKGGPCPACGDNMPANLVHCQSCRALLNHELSEDLVAEPEFVPLTEMNEAPVAVVRGHYIDCPGCSEELRIHLKYRGVTVQCRHCDHRFMYGQEITQKAIFSPCPHCSEELRANAKYLGQKVACRFCDGAMQLRGQKQ